MRDDWFDDLAATVPSQEDDRFGSVSAPDFAEETDDHFEQILRYFRVSHFQERFVGGQFTGPIRGGRTAAKERMIPTEKQAVPGQKVEGLFSGRPGKGRGGFQVNWCDEAAWRNVHDIGLERCGLIKAVRKG
jgi:hypothetical protein